MTIKITKYRFIPTAVMLAVWGCTNPSVERIAKGSDDSDSGETDPVNTDVDTGGDAGSGTDAGRFTVDSQLASDLSPSAPTTVGIVTWSIEDAGELIEAHIDFGLDQSYGMTAPVDLGENGFRTLLLGMKPSRTYHFQITAIDEQTKYTSGDYTIETGPALDLPLLRSYTVLNEARRERGFTVSSTWRGDNMSVVYILDADGEIVWWYETDLPGICSARMSEDGRNMWMVVPCNFAGALGRVTMDGLDYQTYDNVIAAHDITPVSGGTMAYIDYSDSACMSSITEITPNGSTKEVFHAANYITARCHGNALRYSQHENVYALSNLESDILIVGRDGEVKWTLTDIVGPNSTWGYRQHGTHLLDNSILFFANDIDPEVSAVLEYDFEGNQLFDYHGEYYTRHLGDCERLPGGNTWISYSDADSFVQEVAPDGEVVLEIDARAAPDADTSNALGNTLWRDSLYGPPPDLLL